MSLSEVKENREVCVSEISGDTRFVSRITSIGLTPGCRVSVIKNDKNRPMLVYSRDTMIALSKNAGRACIGTEHGYGRYKAKDGILGKHGNYQKILSSFLRRGEMLGVRYALRGCAVQRMPSGGWL